MTSPLLSIRNLEKTYANGTQALNKVTLDVRAGEFLAVIGSSGSGKSTLLRCINRLHDPTRGEIWFEGLRVDEWSGPQVLALRKNIAMIFQHFNLIPRHSVTDNVMMGRLASTPILRSLMGIFSDADRKQAYEFLKLVGISEKAHTRADQLSGGQQQRVAIARALCQQPKLILADEPVASLDPTTAATVMDYLQEINRTLGITIICSLHFLDLVKKYASRVVALKGGTVIFEGMPNQISEARYKQIYSSSDLS